jgi:hypothetical protein
MKEELPKTTPKNGIGSTANQKDKPRAVQAQQLPGCHLVSGIAGLALLHMPHAAHHT